MKNSKNNEAFEQILIPKLQNFFKNKKKNTSLIWIPVETALIFDTNFQQLSTPTKAVFLQLFLLCGVLGNCELPFNINYLSRMLGVNRCRIRDSLSELFETGLCVVKMTPREREREKEQKEQTDRQEENAALGVVSCVDLENSKDERRKTNLELQISDSKIEDQKSNFKNQTSQFSIEECLKYVEICKSKGDEIKNAKALAMNLFKTGEADAFILATLYPIKQKEIDRETYGEPRQFTEEPCKVCYGARLANPDGRGFRKCSHCFDEKGKPTGLEPLADN